jgi:ABC-type nitrate/sulfonate/bicarbonate transport system ATPase subunit
VPWPGGHGRAPTYPPLALWKVLARAGTPPPKLRLVTHDVEKALVLSNRVVVPSQPGRISQMLRLELTRPRQH